MSEPRLAPWLTPASSHVACGREVGQGEAGAVGRLAVDAVAARPERVGAQRRVGGELMADARLRRGRGDHDDLAECRRVASASAARPGASMPSSLVTDELHAVDGDVFARASIQ